MTKLDKEALAVIMAMCNHPCSPGHTISMEPDGKVLEEENRLVKDVPNQNLLDSPLYKAGYNYCWRMINMRLSAVLGDRKTMAAYVRKNKKS